MPMDDRQNCRDFADTNSARHAASPAGRPRFLYEPEAIRRAVTMSHALGACGSLSDHLSHFTSTVTFFSVPVNLNGGL